MNSCPIHQTAQTMPLVDVKSPIILKIADPAFESIIAPPITVFDLRTPEFYDLYSHTSKKFLGHVSWRAELHDGGKIPNYL